MPTLSELRRLNRDTEARASEYRKAVEAGVIDPEAYQTAKHEFPYFGFMECAVAEHRFVIFTANDDVVGWEFLWTGTYESRVTEAWLEIARNAEIVLDVGAYTGVMSIVACLANPRVRVIAFEPMLSTVERLRINLKANRLSSRVDVHTVALSNKEGRTVINMPRPKGFLGTGNSIGKKPGIPTVAKTEVDRVTLDEQAPSVLSSEAVIDGIKLDVEGHELEALQGMQHTIASQRPTLIVEVWPHESSQIGRFFAQMNYRRTQLQGMNHLFTPR